MRFQRRLSVQCMQTKQEAGAPRGSRRENNLRLFTCTGCVGAPKSAQMYLNSLNAAPLGLYSVLFWAFMADRLYLKRSSKNFSRPSSFVLHLCFGSPCRRTGVPIRCRDARKRGAGSGAAAQSDAVHVPGVQTGRPARHPAHRRNAHPPAAVSEPGRIRGGLQKGAATNYQNSKSRAANQP